MSYPADGGGERRRTAGANGGGRRAAGGGILGIAPGSAGAEPDRRYYQEDHGHDQIAAQQQHAELGPR